MIELPARMPEREFLDLPPWMGIDPDDTPGSRYRAEFAGTPYLVTIKLVNGELASGSQRVVFT